MSENKDKPPYLVQNPFGGKTKPAEAGFDVVCPQPETEPVAKKSKPLPPIPPLEPQI